jgi:multiple sugar transport system substrate-binding protein
MQACTRAWREETGVEISWDWRSLTAFGDQPLEEVAPEYDLLVIDHPFCGTAAAAVCLAPLDELLPPERLSELAADSVGPSHASYAFAGRQWGLATDAACQVTAVRDDLLDGAPVDTWEAVLELARSHPGRVTLPLSPPHAISSWLTLVANAGAPLAEGPSLGDAGAGTRAIELLAELRSLGPDAALGWEPPDVLGELTGGDEIACVPLTYGYVTYARAGAVSRPCRFIDIPSAGNGPVGSVLGGAGLAVSATSDRKAEAAAFAGWASGTDAQCRLVAPSGGQPGSRTAWLDPVIDAEAGGFYRGTLATMESTWVRPRDAWWPDFQLEGGRLLNEALTSGAAAGRTFTELDALYRDSVRRNA